MAWSTHKMHCHTPSSIGHLWCLPRQVPIPLMYQQLKHFVTRYGGTKSFIADAIDVHGFPRMGTGIVATKRIAKGQVVFQADKPLWFPFSATCALQEAHHKAPFLVHRLAQMFPRDQQFASLVQQLEEDPKQTDIESSLLLKTSSSIPLASLLAIHLLVDFSPELPQFMYLKTLPTYVDLPYFWEKPRQQELKGNEELASIIAQGYHLYTRLYAHLLGKDNQMLGREQFFWAISILLSRATSGANQPFTLIPFFDFFNHSIEGDECDHFYDPQQQAFVVQTTREYAKGEQLFLRYGQLSNAKLLRNYGFAIDSNPFDQVEVSLMNFLEQQQQTQTPATAQVESERQTLLEQLGFKSKLPTLVINHKGEIAPPSIKLLELFAASSMDELSRVKESLQAKGSATASVNQQVAKQMLEICQSKLTAYPTTLEEDAELLKKPDLEEWMEACLHVRMNQKQMLQQAIAKLKQSLAP